MSFDDPRHSRFETSSPKNASSVGPQSSILEESTCSFLRNQETTWKVDTNPPTFFGRKMKDYKFHLRKNVSLFDQPEINEGATFHGALCFYTMIKKIRSPNFAMQVTQKQDFMFEDFRLQISAKTKGFEPPPQTFTTFPAFFVGMLLRSLRQRRTDTWMWAQCWGISGFFLWCESHLQEESWFFHPLPQFGGGVEAQLKWQTPFPMWSVSPTDLMTSCLSEEPQPWSPQIAHVSRNLTKWTGAPSFEGKMMRKNGSFGRYLLLSERMLSKSWTANLQWHTMHTTLVEVFQNPWR